MRRLLATGLAGLALAFGLLASVPAAALGLDPAFPGPTLGPEHAKGVVVWSHGRSTNAEDSQSPSPSYLRALREDGWEVMRFNRLSASDNLDDSAKRLTEYAGDLRHQGYRQIILAGQSYGAFLSLMVADSSVDVDAVIATAPAAYGSFDDFYDSWRLNATRLYPLLEQVKHARIMVFYFHGDDFDPGGRGEPSRRILNRRGLGYAVVDQPAHLTSHWAASSGLFLRLFGACIRDFADADKLSGELACSPRWGMTPSAEMKLPPEFADPQPPRAEAAAVTSPNGSGAGPEATVAPHRVRDLWYGFYPNGREVMLGIEAVHGADLSGVYAIGPSIDEQYPAAWSRREGHIVDGSFVFEEPGKSTLRFRPRQDGGLGATWTSVDGKTSITAHLKPIDPQTLARRAANEPALPSAPISAAAAHADGDETKH
jgi:dienelactone hydrolase